MVQPVTSAPEVDRRRRGTSAVDHDAIVAFM
jgi:hypothetical protein